LGWLKSCIFHFNIVVSSAQKHNELWFFSCLNTSYSPM
jgi:hypothetical protein